MYMHKACWEVSMYMYICGVCMHMYTCACWEVWRAARITRNAIGSLRIGQRHMGCCGGVAVAMWRWQCGGGGVADAHGWRGG